MKTDLMHRDEVIRLIPRMTYRRFVVSDFYLNWLKIHEVRLSQKMVYFPKEKVVAALRSAKIPFTM